MEKIYGNEIKDLDISKRKVRRGAITNGEKNQCPLDIKDSGRAALTDKAGDDGDYLSV